MYPIVIMDKLAGATNNNTTYVEVLIHGKLSIYYLFGYNKIAIISAFVLNNSNIDYLTIDGNLSILRFQNSIYRDSNWARKILMIK